MMHHPVQSSQQPFFRYDLWQEIPPIPDGAWRAYIHTRLETRGRTIAEDAIDAILDAPGGHPYDTMEVAYDAYVLQGDRPGPIDRAVALGAVDHTQDTLKAVFQAEVEALGPKARLVLGRLANSRPLYQGDRSNGAIRSAVQNLINAGVLVREARGWYSLTEPMLANYLKAK